MFWEFSFSKKFEKGIKKNVETVVFNSFFIINMSYKKEMERLSLLLLI